MHRSLSVMFYMLVLMGLSGIVNACVSSSSSAPVQQETRFSQNITVSLRVPDLAWEIHIAEIYIIGTELWVISLVERSGDAAAQMLATVTDTVTVSAPSLPIKHFIVGKQWTWDNPEPYVFLQAQSEITAQLQRGGEIFPQ
jgi:hypothetical protein